MLYQGATTPAVVLVRGEQRKKRGREKRERRRREQWSICIHLSLFPDCMRGVANVLLLCLPSNASLLTLHTCLVVCHSIEKRH